MFKRIIVESLLLTLLSFSAFTQAIKLADLKSCDASFISDVGVVLISRFDQLTITDGTIAGTKNTTLPAFAQEFKQIGNDIYFFSYDRISDYHSLNKFSCVTNQLVSLGKVNKYNQRNLVRLATVISEKLYFIAMDSSNNPQLWQSDGTLSGTINLHYPFSNFYNQGKTISYLATFNDKLLIANYGELWITDGFSSTTKIKEADANKDYSTIYLGSFAELNGFLYFSAYDSMHGQEVWRTDGTSSGTTLFQDLSPGFLPYNPSLASSSYPGDFRRIGNFIYFTTNYSSLLWRTDGTMQGTILLKKCDNNDEYCIRNLSKFNDKLIFTYNDSTTGKEPWITDGTVGKTMLVKDIWQGPASSISSDHSFISDDVNCYLPADDGTNGQQIWEIDSLGNAKVAMYTTMDKSISSMPFVYEFNNKLIYVSDKENSSQLFSIENSLFSFVDFTPNPRLPADYWFQTIGAEGYNPGIVFNYDMAVSTTNDIILAGVYIGNRLIFYDNQITTPFDFSTTKAFLSKFNSNGILVWTKELQTTEAFYRKYASIATGTDGVVYYATTSNKSKFIDLAPTDKNINAYLVKLDKTGNSEWLSGGYAGKDIQISNLKVDNEGNIFMTGLYFGFSFRWGNSILTSNVSPAYFIQKFDPKGNSIWAKNISTGWKEYGDITDMEIDYSNKRIILLISQGGRNVSSSCEYERWPAQIKCYNFEGNLYWQKQFDCSDLMTANSLAVGPNGDIVIVGRYRGTLAWDSIKLTSAYKNGCHINTSFVARINSDCELKALNTDNPNNIEPFEIQFLKNGNYLISGIERHMDNSYYIGYDSPYPSSSTHMFIREYDYGGDLLAERKFNKYENDFYESNPIVRVDSNKDIIFSERSSGKFDSISYSVNQWGSLSLVMMKTNLKLFKDEAESHELGEKVQIFPNPTHAAHI
ncbi:MAG: hypothetical protein JST48_00240 [Bacteroidetes bacterium]|nr:hypothetical protein [Bacteroidota bacterium]